MANLCRGADALAMTEAAVAILEPLGPSVELAWAYANLASHRMLQAQSEAAIGLATRAQAIAEPLGALEVLSDALNTQGCAASSLGQDGATALRRALDIAVSGRLLAQAGRAFTNICNVYVGRRQFADAERYFTEGVAYCDEHDITTYARCLRCDWITALERTGRWPESLALSQELLNRPSASPINRLVPLSVIGLIRARLGEPGVWEHLDDAADFADGTAEPQYIVSVRLARAEAFWLEGKPAAAVREAELADDVSADSDAWDRGAVAVWLRRTGSARPPAASWPIPTGCRPAATGSRPRGSGPGWAARTRPPWPCTSPGRRPRCARR